MTTELLPVDLIRTLSMLLVITSVAAVEIRRLRLSAVAYSIQALLIVALLASFARGNPALYLWAGTALVTKAVLTPYFLFRAIGAGDDRELKPLIGFAPSVMVAALLMLGFYRLTHTHVALLAPSAHRAAGAVPDQPGGRLDGVRARAVRGADPARRHQDGDRAVPARERSPPVAW